MSWATAVCRACDGDGYTDIVDDMGGVVGPRPCEVCEATGEVPAICVCRDDETYCGAWDCKHAPASRGGDQ